ncbi:E3 ubiquitin-protein ligase Ubr3 [Anopheles bellator]|uniref:E3 ubiquitin-protein ligase Ubr3 n=1 Tax=Anopheles bellator TaxID=139047 RepID=UPI00264705C4|nr:E3 ubiquitin-protein ligase Ubr3 [Anopheles bellator]
MITHDNILLGYGRVRAYDNHAKCGLVWIPHVVAYRCRTCGISPCMSICRDCFKRGNHQNHDFNMFLSQAGGACDCGDTSVMKPEGFCSDHGLNSCPSSTPVPDDLLLPAEAMMPRLILRMLLHFREFSAINHDSAGCRRTAEYCNDYCAMLMEFNNMGELMRRVMTRTLIDRKVYRGLFEQPYPINSNRNYLRNSRRLYEDALHQFPSPEPPPEYAYLPALGRTIVHGTLLEEFIFWTFKYEFQQQIVCFLLNMLPDQDYKEHLTRTFVMHYCRIPSVLELSNDPDTLSNRVVHMSVQLFSNESLALKMVEELSLLHVMIISLRQMMAKILTPHLLHNPERNFHYVVDCAERVMKEHCYWPLVSDFNNVLSHESVALVFLQNDALIDMWFQFLSMLQGMNVNLREIISHVEYESSSYYAAFSCELEASAYPMWSVISHLQDPSHAPLAKNIMMYCVNYLNEWLEAVNFYQHPKFEKDDMFRASFHFPLHRYLAAFVCQGVKTMGMSLKDILPRADLLPMLMMHPLRVQSLFYEILSGVWVRNGLQIKGQAMTYIQANFCNSMVDMDLFFLQICSTQLPPNLFVRECITMFGIEDWIGMSLLSTPPEMEQDSMLEGLLTFFATLITSRVNLGNDETTQCIIEIGALLATGDKTHSQLLELMPERSGNAHARNFERYLKQLSIYRPPLVGSENLEQGLFMPVPEVWERYYDPLHVLLRAVHRRDFQNSLDRFGAYVKQTGKMPASGNLWPPFRLPSPCGPAYSDPGVVLCSRIFHATILAIFYRAVHTHNVSEHMLALAVFLLEMAVSKAGAVGGDATTSRSTVGDATYVSGSLKNRSTNVNEVPISTYACSVPNLLSCYPSNCLSDNLKMTVNRISLLPVIRRSPVSYHKPSDTGSPAFDSDVEWDLSEDETLMMIGSISDAMSTYPCVQTDASSREHQQSTMVESGTHFGRHDDVGPSDTIEECRTMISTSTLVPPREIGRVDEVQCTRDLTITDNRLLIPVRHATFVSSTSSHMLVEQDDNDDDGNEVEVDENEQGMTRNAGNSRPNLSTDQHERRRIPGRRDDDLIGKENMLYHVMDEDGDAMDDDVRVERPAARELTINDDIAGDVGNDGRYNHHTDNVVEDVEEAVTNANIASIASQGTLIRSTTSYTNNNTSSADSNSHIIIDNNNSNNRHYAIQSHLRQQQHLRNHHHHLHHRRTPLHPSPHHQADSEDGEIGTSPMAGTLIHLNPTQVRQFNVGEEGTTRMELVIRHELVPTTSNAGGDGGDSGHGVTRIGQEIAYPRSRTSPNVFGSVSERLQTVATGSDSSNNGGDGILLPFNRVQPVTVTNRIEVGAIMSSTGLAGANSDEVVTDSGRPIATAPGSSIMIRPTAPATPQNLLQNYYPSASMTAATISSTTAVAPTDRHQHHYYHHMHHHHRLYHTITNHHHAAGSRSQQPPLQQPQQSPESLQQQTPQHYNHHPISDSHGTSTTVSGDVGGTSGISEPGNLRRHPQHWMRFKPRSLNRGRSDIGSEMTPSDGDILDANCPNDNGTVLMEESIISLLLKLHSQLSGALDSFSLDDETEKKTDLGDEQQQPQIAVSVATISDSQAMELDEDEPSSGIADSDGHGANEGNDRSRKASNDNTGDVKSIQQQQRMDQSELGSCSDRTSTPCRDGGWPGRAYESRIGDGPFFIGSLLRKIAALDASCAARIDEVRRELWPNQRERQAEQKAREAREKEERTKRAKERQKKMMEEFANRQKRFMLLAMTSMGGDPSSMDCFEDEEEEDVDEVEAAEAELQRQAQLLRETEYDCIICNTSGPSTESNPIGLVVLVETTSVMGHRRNTNDRFVLPLCSEDSVKLQRNVTLAGEFSKRVDLLQWKFGQTSWFLSHNVGWEGGVYIQSCGHHVHLSCQDSYLKSLHTPRSPNNLNVEMGEFFCPVCRQLANSVLPLSPALDRPATLIRTPTPTHATLVLDLIRLFQENKRATIASKFCEAMGRAMGNITACTQRNIKKFPVTRHSLFSFVVSIARTNLEAEIIQRGGSLCSKENIRFKPKRDCIVPLLHVLSLHVRWMINDDWPIRFKLGDDWPWHSWSRLAGIQLGYGVDKEATTSGTNNKSSSNDVCDFSSSSPTFSTSLQHCSEKSTAATAVSNAGDVETIPDLISDPTALMLKFILLAPLHLDEAYFTCIVKVLYNLLYYQVVLQLCTHLTDDECEELIACYGTGPEMAVHEKGVSHIGVAMAFILNHLDRCKYIRSDSILMADSAAAAAVTTAAATASHTLATHSGAVCCTLDGTAATSSKDNGSTSRIDLGRIETRLQHLCLPFLRVAALLHHHIYHKELPVIAGPHLEFARLIYYLDLVTVSMDWDNFNASKALCFLPGTELLLPKNWCDQLRNLRPTYESTRSLIVSQHIEWCQPKLLGLPREYERLFTYYHEQPCQKCQNVPKESSICLLCGTIVCIKQTCCKEQDCCEAVRHSISCGAGTGIFLVITSTYIIIIRGHRACLWGSLYLDDYDEEDRDLKRGKPLYLSEDRFNLLESQWLSHRFAHTKHNWVWHRDSL